MRGKNTRLVEKEKSDKLITLYISLSLCVYSEFIKCIQIIKFGVEKLSSYCFQDNTAYL